MTKHFCTFLTAIVVGAMLTACHDDTDDFNQPAPDSGTWQVSVVSGNDHLSRYASYESLTVKIAGYQGGSGTVRISSSSDWLTVVSDTLAADSIVAFTTTDNDTEQRRTATLTFTSVANPQQKGSVMLTQLSSADDDENAEEARTNLYIGYGYNVYVALENPMSVRTLCPILDLNTIRKNQANGMYSLMQDCRLSYIDMKYTMAYSLRAFGQDLTEQQTGDRENSISGCSSDCKNVYNLMNNDAKGKLTQNIYGQGVIDKAVASRIIDKGMLLNLKKHDLVPFTGRFLDSLRAIRYAKGADRQRTLRNTIRMFGTHVVTQVDLGGSLKYTFTMDRYASFNSKEEIIQEIKYTMGQMSDSERTQKNRTTSSSKTADGAIKIHGGSSATRDIIKNDIQDKEQKGQIVPSHVSDWLSTINYTEKLNLNENLDVIHFELVPIWDIVFDDLRREFLNEVIRMRENSDFQLPDEFLGTDIYEFDTNSNPQLFDFTNATVDSTLCRIIYSGYDASTNDGSASSVIADATGAPVLQICSEYVPAIRTDQRVTVVYPIYDQHVYMNQGFFLGDGIHQPALIGFKGNECYALPVDTIAPGKYIEKFWYVGGNLSLENPTDIKSITSRRLRCENDYFYYYHNGAHRHPIVKIGSNFWTRRDVNHLMGFTSDPHSKGNRSDDHLVDGVLYARFYYDIGYYQKEDNELMWGNKPNTYFEGHPNTKWYFPDTDEVSNLYSFLGFNPKALFIGQQSGFDAQFNGYYGIHDLISNETYGTNNKVCYKDSYCFIASRDKTQNLSRVMALDSRYNLRMMSVLGDWSEDYFTIRPVRGWMFDYPMLSDLIDFINL